MQCVKPVEIWHGSKRYIVPCGKCLCCLSNKRNDWVFRLQQEHKASKGALFVTLTYAPKYCPDELQKSHVQLFLKRLRKHEKKTGIRYFAVGEYGTNYGRPHYHLLLFNCDLSGNTIRRSWCNRAGEPFGIVHIGQVTAQSIAYCTKYVIQKGEGDKKPFTLMSRAYGLGAAYLSDNMVAWHREDDRNYAIVNGQKVRLPRFYKTKIWYNEDDKKRVSSKSKWDAIRSYRKNLRLFVKKFGKGKGRVTMEKFRDIHLSRIKTKVAYTQTL